MMDIRITSTDYSQPEGPQPAADYSWRPPSPPRIYIPPVNEERDNFLRLYEAVDPKDPMNEDLKQLQHFISTQQSYVPAPYRSWKYSDRRCAQAMLPFLYLGPSSAAKDIEVLKSEGFTMLLVIRDTAMAHARILSGERVAQQLGIQAASIDVSGNQELIAAFPRAVETINKHIINVFKRSGYQRWGKVLVFCESGNERSACIIAAYIMHMHGTGVVETIQFIHQRRFCVALDDEHKNLLLSYNHILSAQRDVLRTQTILNQPVPENSMLCTKRRRSMEEDVDMDDEDADDEARFRGRSGFVPFL
ncbi:Serine/threonine/tyrosine-interacting protein [Phlyctema vagabunda]|uniref:Serine/threonine/tyrosine-interacting protein n=1 Tax=Phlyctema vagabunda TaxID=108571 RepID=A0ABR4P537_9HELO